MTYGTDGELLAAQIPGLRRYARALGGEARLGLYFPLIPGWREVG